MLENENGLKISVLVSGGGTNLQAVIDGIKEGVIPNAEIVRVISSSEKAYALERAKSNHIDGLVINKKNYTDSAQFNEALIQALDEVGTNLVVLAGYMKILQPEVIQKYKGKIINIHPSLIPKYCGPGFYGHKVHEAVLLANETESGATVHFVDEGVDTGEMIMQEKVEVRTDDTVDTLAARVLQVEHKIIQEAIIQYGKKLETGGN
ncbi:MAG: phosphoribosylglycinamide formyltransferase [Anaerovorax sp.]